MANDNPGCVRNVPSPPAIASWGTFTGLAIILLAGGLAAGALPIRAEDFFPERSASSQKISKSLVTLSSAAIVAIYAAGYHRTSSAAHRFDSQAEQGRISAAITAVVPPAATNPAIDTVPPGSRSPAPSVKKNSVRQPNAVPKAAPKAAPTQAGPRDAAATPGANAAAAAVGAGQNQYKDGLFLGWGSCPHGDIEASVLIQGGKIVSAAISQCLTRYSCSWISPRVPSAVLPDLPQEVVERQSAKVDYVSGATESSYAFADAITAALHKASE